MVITRTLRVSCCILFLFVMSFSQQVIAGDIIQPDEHEPILIDGDEALLDVSSIEGWPGTGTEDLPIVIKGLSIESQEYGIYISNVDLYFQIEECLITKNETGSYSSFGIHLENCSHASIEKCVIWKCEFGICLSNSNYADVHRTEIYESFFGVFVNRSYGVWLRSLDVIVCGVGIRFNHSTYAYVEHTIVDNCEISGIEGICDYGTHLRYNTIIGGEVGILMAENENWVVEDSMIWECDVGIATSHTTGGFILRSMIKNCSSIGIDLAPNTSNITVLECWMGPDNLQNACDDGDGNLWCDEYEEIGNYWSDYISGTGPYTIPGSAGSVDLYPMSLEDAPNWEDVVITDETPTDGSTTNDTPIDTSVLVMAISTAFVTLLIALAMLRSRVGGGLE